MIALFFLLLVLCTCSDDDDGVELVLFTIKRTGFSQYWFFFVVPFRHPVRTSMPMMTWKTTNCIAVAAI